MEAVIILVVDDDLLMRDMLARRLRRSGLPLREVLSAATPEVALKLLDGAEPGPLVVVSDFNLKGSMSGVELLAEVRRRRPDAMRVLMSGYSLEQIGRQGDAVERFFEKPLELDALVRPLGEAIVARFGP